MSAVPDRPVARRRPSPSDQQHSSVTLWKSGRGRRWSVTVVDGVTAAQLEELIQLAEDAADRIEGRVR